MSEQDLINLASNYMEIWNAGKEDILDKWAHPDIIVEYSHFGKTYK